MNPTDDYSFAADGAFCIRGYGTKKPFANFLPGIAGLHGTPMWVFTVNRGQAVVSFGTRDKDGAILEFFPANKAYQMVSRVGFRTFVKYRTSGASARRFACYEPFADVSQPGGDGHHRMDVRAHELVLHEQAAAPALTTEVVYFTLPDEPIAALVRRVTITNRSTRAVDVEVLDGLPQILPYGMNEFFVKQMSRTIEAWMTVENAAAQAPFFKLKVEAGDRPEVLPIDAGNFYFASGTTDGGVRSLPIIVDPSTLFGPALDFSSPHSFCTPDEFALPTQQIRMNRTPCAFAFQRARLAPGASMTLTAMVGRAASVDVLNQFTSRARAVGYVEAKRERNRLLIDGLKSRAFTVSASPSYDAYCGQTYLDNVLRGGLPLCLGEGREPLVYYVFSRKHGDLERDYNRFLVEDTYFARGDGNYRDVNQNRRCDVWFEPRTGDANLKTFFNLLQLDGFNPLVVKGGDLRLRPSKAARAKLDRWFGARHAAAVQERMSKPFQLGELCRWLEERGWCTPNEFDAMAQELAPHWSLEECAEHGEGFWVDHWIYNLDLIESYLAVFPEKLAPLLIGDRSYRFYDNAHRVVPRSEKYRRLPDGRVRQYGAVVFDEAKAARLGARGAGGQWVRTRHGRGPELRVTLLTKLVCLFANKLASLDPQGVGIEMEADKPSWYDALNGLPGLAGSSVGESFELDRLAEMLLGFLDVLANEPSSAIDLPVEIHAFVVGLDRCLVSALRRGRRSDPWRYWDEATQLKEDYRAAIVDGVSGDEAALSLVDLRAFVERARRKLALGLERAFDGDSGLCRTYYRHEVTRHRPLTDGRVQPLAFRSLPLPHFLEGPVHALKLERDPERRRRLYRAVRRSGLYDRTLGMYKVNSSIESESFEIGRARVFAPGWLENESIWLHMEYKYLLEVLEAGLHDEFFADLRRALVPFQPAERYGRCLLENSSFIASSAFPDPALHGAGFVARLSGSTAEFVQMWLHMNIGPQPFLPTEGDDVALRFAPTLPAWWFTTEEVTRPWVDAAGAEHSIRVPADAFAWLFLGKTLVTYRNPKRRDTFGKRGVRPRQIQLHDAGGQVHRWDGDTVPAPFARQVRDGYVPRIDVELG